jgi:Icc-related predicted phosphoesterase
MRFLLFSDLHSNERVAQRLVEMSREVDAVIGAGDFCNMRRGLPGIIQALSAIQCPAVLVPGNAESYEELSAACQTWPTATVLHGSGTEIDGTAFWGVGGAIPVTPFGSWSYDFSEDEGRQLLAQCPEGAIIITHPPPQGVLDESSSGRSLGSAAVREAIERCRPPLVVCGHIHDCAGRSSTLNKSHVVNAGPRGIVWNMQE